MWVTRPELSATGTCSVCCPLDGRKEKRRKDFGVPYPSIRGASAASFLYLANTKPRHC